MWLFLSGFCFHHLVGVIDELAKAVEDEIRNPRAKRAEDHNTKTKNDGDGSEGFDFDANVVEHI